MSSSHLADGQGGRRGPSHCQAASRHLGQLDSLCGGNRGPGKLGNCLFTLMYTYVHRSDLARVKPIHFQKLLTQLAPQIGYYSGYQVVVLAVGAE